MWSAWAVKVICGDVEYGHPGSPYDALSVRDSIGQNVQNQTQVGDLEDENFASQISRGGWPGKGL